MRKVFKVMIYFILALIVLLLIIVLTLQTPWAKNTIRVKVQTYVQDKTKTTFKIGSIDFSFPKWIEIQDIFLLDRANDTLLMGKHLKVDLDMFALIRSKYVINKVMVQQFYVNLYNKEVDSTYNFQFLIDAFRSKKAVAKVSDTTQFLNIIVKEIDIANTHFKQNDHYLGNFMNVSVKKFHLDVDSIDLRNWQVDINDLNVEGLDFSYVRTKVQPVAKLPNPIFTINKTTIKTSHIYYENKPNYLLSNNFIDYLGIVDLNNTSRFNTYSTRSIVLNNSNFIFQHKKENEIIKAVADTLTAIAKNNTSLGILIDSIALQNNSVVYNNMSHPKKSRGMDFYHLDMNGLKLKTSKIKFENGNLQANIQSFAFKDKSGFAIDTFSGLVNLDSSSMYFKDLYLKTPYSKIAVTAHVFPESFMASDKQKFPRPENNIRLTQAIISKKDLELLAETMAKSYGRELDILGDLSINAYIIGNVDKISISNLIVNSVRNNDLSIHLSGEVFNLTISERLFYNLSVKDITASKQLMALFIPKNTQPLNLPNQLSLYGLIKGTLKKLNTNVTLNSSYGTLGVKAAISEFQVPSKMVYDLALNAVNLETGKWIGRDSMLGLLNGDIKVKGSNGFDLKSNKMSVVAAIQSFRFNQNTLNNIKTDLHVSNGVVGGQASIDDELMKVLFDGQANMQAEYPSADAAINMIRVNLNSLGLSKDTIILSALTRIKIENSSPHNLYALIEIDSSAFVYGSRIIPFDSTRALAMVRNDTTFLDVSSPFVDAELNSTVYYDQMATFAKTVIKQFLPAAMSDGLLDANKYAESEKGAINATIVVKPHDVYTTFFKDLIFEKAIDIKGQISNANVDSVVNIKFNVPSLTVGSFHVSPTDGTILGRNDSLLVNVFSDTLKASSFSLYDAYIKGVFSKNQVTANILTHDINKKEQYGLTVFAVPNSEKGYNISMGKDLLLNKIKWLVDENNEMKINPAGFNIQDFVITNEQQQIQVNNETTLDNSPLLVNVTNFELNSITAMLDKNTLSVDGLLNVDLKVSDMKNTIPTIDGQVNIDSFTYQNISIGDIDLLAQSERGIVKVDGKLYGNGNEVNMTGVYADNNINANLHLNRLTMTTIEAFSFKKLKNSSGIITGHIGITGEPAKPIWNGQIMLDSLQTTAAEYGTTVKMDNQVLRLAYPTVFFDKLTIEDGVNNKLTIDGTISQNISLLDDSQGSTKTNNFTTDLVIKAKGFRALNNTAVDNQMINGMAFMDVDAQVSGSALAPNISGNLIVKNGTDVTYVRQMAAPSAQEREGVIEFIDRDTINLLKTISSQGQQASLDPIKKSGILNFNLNLEVEKDAKFIVIVDPISGDELHVQGTARINAGVNPNGSIGLVGTYYLSKGIYELNYQFIKRKFNLLEGSLITLSGDPLKADVDITAAYDVKTPAIDLIKNEIGGATATGNEIYKRKAPFRILLKVKGQIDNPSISFDIILPDKAEGVTNEMATTINNKLDQLRADESSMNKQVFAILILNKFIGEQSSDFFASNGSSNILSNESVSSFLNGAINQIANDLIKGVDVDVNLKNVDEDPNQQRTDLKVALGKNFLNDRMNISVGKSFTVDGTNPPSNNNNTSAQYIPDVNTTYKLSKDGRFLLRAYRKNQYEALLDGYFIETGVSLNFTIDYDKFREILYINK